MALAEAKIEGFVGTICLDHIEKRNSLSGALSDEIIKALDNFTENWVRVVVLRARSGVNIRWPATTSTNCRKATATRWAGMIR